MPSQLKAVMEMAPLYWGREAAAMFATMGMRGLFEIVGIERFGSDVRTWVASRPKHELLSVLATVRAHTPIDPESFEFRLQLIRALSSLYLTARGPD